ncbi:MAG TPA: DUF3857 domain-containing protein [Bacteroidales bacterium]|nr:DUF3857 domain-containing protein [Bacteroidales bacterium]
MRTLGRFCFCILLLLPWKAQAEEIKYPVFTIDSSLLRNADVVIRYYEMAVQINSLNSMEVGYHIVVTILNESAISDAWLEVLYDDNSRVEELYGNIYNAIGVRTHKISGDDIDDESAISGGNLYSNDRKKTVRPIFKNYPVTVEYYYWVSQKRILDYPAWKPQDSFRQSVESAKLSVTSKEGLFPRLKEMNIPARAVISGDQNQYRSWEIKNLAALQQEPVSPPLEERVPIIFMGPNDYSARGYTGNFSSWQGYGEWIYSLNSGRDTLSASRIQLAQELTRGEQEPLKKVQTLYHYLQKTTRYVSVVLGIGGLQPEEAEKVAEKGYGDCKGLVIYLKALLKAVNIPSFYTLVESGENASPIQKDFPGMQFNHVILCVPLKSDTVWLECTSQYQPFGFLGDFTSDRYGLMITPLGGILVRTPSYGKSENTLVRNVQIQLDSAGNARVEMISRYRGLQYDNMEEFLHMPYDKQIEEVTDYYKLSGAKVTSFSIMGNDSIIPELKMTLQINIRNFASKNGDRVFVPLNKFVDQPGVPLKNDSRITDLYLKFAYTDIDSVKLSYPSCYRVESKPAGSEFSTIFGKYTTTIMPGSSQLYFARLLEKEKGRFPAVNYNDYVNFLRQIDRQDRNKVVLILTANSSH